MLKLRSNHFNINYFTQQKPLDHSSCKALFPEVLLTALFQALPKEKELEKGPPIVHKILNHTMKLHVILKMKKNRLIDTAVAVLSLLIESLFAYWANFYAIKFVNMPCQRR